MRLAASGCPKIIADVLAGDLPVAPGAADLRRGAGRGDRAAAGLGVPVPRSCCCAGCTTTPYTYTFIVGWAGMRGVVTLAAAFAIPQDFPLRDVLVLVALVVTGGTLFIHGLSPALVGAAPAAARARCPGEDALTRASLLPGRPRRPGSPGAGGATSHEPDPHGTPPAAPDKPGDAGLRGLGAAAALRAPTRGSPSDAYARLRLEDARQ